MTRKQNRLVLVLASLAILGIAAGLVLYAIRDTIVFFYTPSELAEKGVAPGTNIRLGGLVESGSFSKEGNIPKFVVTDKVGSIKVTYVGKELLPDLFREGQGVVAEGKIGSDGNFLAEKVLAKHDENYMPKDVADKLKEKGVWKEGGAQ